MQAFAPVSGTALPIVSVETAAKSDYRARYYDPQPGRFVSEDPAKFASGTDDFYAYVENSSLNFRDPFGLQKPGVQAGTPANCCQKNIDLGKNELGNALQNAQLMRGRIVKKYKDCLLKTLPLINIKCNTTRTDCGVHSSAGLNTIAITPLGAQGRKGPCGPVASTLVHEMVHNCQLFWGDPNAPVIPRLAREGEAFSAECELFGTGCACARDPKKCGYQ
jgi:RHS repeat-associated protein